MVRTYVKVADRGKTPKMTDAIMRKLQKERLAGTISTKDKIALEEAESANTQAAIDSLFEEREEPPSPVVEPPDDDRLDDIFNESDFDPDYDTEDNEDAEEMNERKAPDSPVVEPPDDDIYDNIFNPSDFDERDSDYTDDEHVYDWSDGEETEYSKQERRELTLLKIFGQAPPRRDERGQVILPKASIAMSKKGAMMMGDFANPSMTQNPVSTPRALKKARKLTIDTAKPPAKPPRRLKKDFKHMDKSPAKSPAKPKKPRKKATKNLDKTREAIISSIKDSPDKPKKRRKKATKNMDKTRDNIMTGLNAY